MATAGSQSAHPPNYISAPMRFMATTGAISTFTAAAAATDLSDRQAGQLQRESLANVTHNMQ